MSEALKHECGIALVRLRKPISYYTEKYGTPLYGMNKLYLLMEKQHNRGQEGAGLACIKLTAQAGNEYIFRERALGSGAIGECFASANKAIAEGRAAELSDEDKELFLQDLGINALRGRMLRGTPALQHRRSQRYVVRAPLPATQQLAQP